ncbi:MAG TPA: S8 family serine peptidase, partial [Chitinophagaceae bacterium]|nr:S8 family serine peptidase [Chitinophagaceae bacterium]
VKDRMTNLGKLAFIGFVHPVFKSPSGKDMGYGDELVVKLKAGTGITHLEDFVKKNNCSIVKKYAFADKIYIISSGQANNYDAVETANRFFESGLFEYAEPDLTLFDGLTAAPNDPLYNYEWAHQNTGSAIQYNGTPGVDMKVQQAWDITRGAGIKVAIIDEGVDLTHPDLQANLLQGFDATKFSSGPGDGKPLSPNNGHGTSCAGIIAAIANNNIGVAGVAPESKIMPINVVMSSGIFTSYGGIASGFDYAWQSGADVISNSWGGGSPSSVLDDAITRAVTLGRGGKGTVVLFSSGNGNASISYPSSNANVICVGGISMCGERKSFGSCDGEPWWGANYGPGLDVAAPCVKVATTDISSAGGYNTAAGTNGDYFLEFNGTSSAAPNAAGVVALILAANNNLTANQATSILESSCTKLSNYGYSVATGQPNGTWNEETGHGMVNALDAVQSARTGYYCSVQIKANGPTRFCAGGSVNLSVINPEPGTTYQWRKDGINFSTGASVNVLASGSYDVVATAANGCVANVAPVIVASLANAAPLVADAGADIFIDCLGPKAVKLGGNPVADKGAPFLPEKRVYGMDWFTNNFVRFSLTDPQHFETVASNMVSGTDYQAKSFFTGGDFTPYGYYAITQNTNRLVTIDTSTGVQQLIGVAITPGTPEKPKYWSGLTWDQSTKTLYALASGEDSSSLYTIDPFTATASFVTAVPLGRIFWLTANKKGELYGFHARQRTVCRIDKKTGAISLLDNNIGITLVDYIDPVAFAGRQDADFDPLTDELYLTALVTAQPPFELQSSDLRKIAVNGQSTIIGPLGFFAAVDATGIAGPGYQYQWSPATGLSSTTVAVPVANPTSTITYTLKVTDMCGNTASSQVTVHVDITKPPVTITASADNICGASSVRLSATVNNGYAYQWFKDGVTINGATDSFYTASQSGNYTIKAILEGCDSLSRPFVINQCQTLLLNNNDPVSVCDTRFYDSGGSAGNYGNNEVFTKTITPATPGNLVQFSIDSLDLDNGDLLEIYEGPNTSTTHLMAMLTGKSNAPQTYISKLGSLTMSFISNGAGTSRGWFGRINCYQSAVYRSKKTGVYSDISTWEIKSAAGFVNATVLPSVYDDSIIIRTGHTVTIDNAVQLDQLLVEAGAVLRLSNTLDLYDGPGDDLVVNGTLEMSGTLNINSGTMRLNGNLLAVTSGSDIVGRVDVSGNAEQTITMAVALYSGWLNITNPLVTINLQANSLLDQIVINNGGKVNLVGGRTLFIRMLTLTSGRLMVTGDDTLLKINPGGTITGGNASSFVEGPLGRGTAVPDRHTLFFPIGNGVYRPVWLELTPPFSGIVYNYWAQIFNGAPPGRVLPASLSAVSGVRYLQLGSSKVLVGETATERITLNYGPDDGAQDASSLRIAKDNVSGNWIDLGATGATNDTGNITSGVSFMGVGNFVLATATPSIPACVTNISPENGSTISTATIASLSWNAVTHASSYDVYIWSGATAPATPIATVTTTSYNVTDLAPSTLYNWHVVPKNAAGAATGCISNKTTFTTAVVSGTQGTGLQGVYYNGTTLAGTPLLTRIDPTINFVFDYIQQPVVLSPAPGIVPEDLYSVSWTGFVQPLYTETYTFYTNSDDGIRLWVNNVLLVDSWIDQDGSIQRSGTIALVAGQKYDIKIEFYEKAGSSVTKLYWSSPSTAKAIVPRSQLFPPATTPAPTGAGTGLTGDYFNG